MQPSPYPLIFILFTDFFICLSNSLPVDCFQAHHYKRFRFYTHLLQYIDFSNKSIFEASTVTVNGAGASLSGAGD
jgi:hypothetical protein